MSQPIEDVIIGLRSELIKARQKQKNLEAALNFWTSNVVDFVDIEQLVLNFLESESSLMPTGSLTWLAHIERLRTGKTLFPAIAQKDNELWLFIAVRSKVENHFWNRIEGIEYYKNEAVLIDDQSINFLEEIETKATNLYILEKLCVLNE